MSLEFPAGSLAGEWLHRDHATGYYPEALNKVLSPEDFQAAYDEISQWPGYRPTPLHSLAPLAEGLGLGAIYLKDEGHRFGLGSFKALGGSYAVMRLLSQKLGAPVSEIRTGKHAEAAQAITVCTATDGNHGRSVAWGAQMAGCPCKIYIHAEVSEGRKRAMEAFGAEVVRVDGDYDYSVHTCAAEAEKNGWFVVSDTSYEGYMEIPRDVMAGYSVMAKEITEQLNDQPPTHLFVQAGVGGVAASLTAFFWQRYGAERPIVTAVEPKTAACVLESAKRGKPSTVPLNEETIMAGLSCGEVSLLAWDILDPGMAHVVALPDEGVGPAMRLLASGKASGQRIVTGESGVPGLLGLLAASASAENRAALGLDGESRVLLIGCEGATDPEIYQQIVGEAP